MSKDLRYFLKKAREAGPDFYAEASKPLKPELEVAILQDKLTAEGRNVVLYCPEITGSKLPLVTNFFGSYELLALALDMDTKRMEKPEILQEYMRREGKTVPPQTVPASEAPVKEVIIKGKDVDLGLLPITNPAELNSGKYIPIGTAILKDPDTGAYNAGVYRHEVKGKDQLGFMVTPAHHGAYIGRRCAELGKPMEAAICIGHHPLVSIGACARGGLEEDELELIGGLLEEPLQMTKAETVDLLIPAQGEIIIEGVIDTKKRITDGPYSEWVGYYGDINPLCWLLQVTAITMRHDAIYHDLDPCHPEHTKCTLLGMESGVYRMVKQVVPTVKAVHLPWSGRHVLHAYVSIKKRVEGEGKRAGLAAIGEALTTLVIVVDEDINVYNEEEVLWAVASRMVGDLDILILPRVQGAFAHPRAYSEVRNPFNLLEPGSMNTKVVIDATKPVGGPFPTRVTHPRDLWDSMNLADYIKK